MFGGGAVFPVICCFRGKQKTRMEPHMQVTLRERLMHYGQLLQGTLFGVLEEVTGPLTERARLLVAVLEMGITRVGITICVGVFFTTEFVSSDSAT